MPLKMNGKMHGAPTVGPPVVIHVVVVIGAVVVGVEGEGSVVDKTPV